ncbi:MAG TPA: oligosaccharide flippase family protein [Patescibacteria group bacterium]|nr:oligosaccharide flippase family protein [Patescibacteria group bacterium]
MREKILAITRSATFRHTGIVTTATVINGILGFVFFWWVARVFDAKTLGEFSVAVTASGLVTDIAVVGTETGTVNFVGKYIKKEKEKALRFLKLAFETKIVVCVLVVVIGWFLVPFFAIYFFKNSSLILPLRLSLFISVGLLLFGFATSSLQAIQKFNIWGLVNISSNFTRLVFMAILLATGSFALQSGLIIQTVAPIIFFISSLLFLPRFLGVKNENKVLQEFFHYNKWVALFTILAAVASRLDIFFVTRILGLTAVGIYSVAVTLSSIIPQLVGAIGTVVAPKLAGQNNKTQAIEYLKKLQVFVGVLSLLGIVSGIFVGYFFIRHFYKPEYFASFVPFIVLLVAQVVFLFSIPVHMTTIYYFSYPKLFVTISLVNVIVVTIFCLVLIPIFGIAGAALAILFGSISNFIIPAFWVFGKFKND